MKILIPGPPKDISKPQWWLVSMDINLLPGKNISWVVDALVRLRWISVQVRYQAAVDNPTLVFVRASRFTSVFIIHPNGGGAQRLKCEECGAEYPMPAPGGQRSGYPCAFCSVERESVVRLWWQRTSLRYIGAPMYSKMRRWPQLPKPITDGDEECADAK
jgi:hypothetical protein